MSAGSWSRPSAPQIGQLAHRVIADLLRHAFTSGSRPSIGWRQVLEAVDERMARDGYRDRAARQTITAAALAYLTVTPPAPWQFLGAEVRRPGVRFDVVWLQPHTGEVIVDEVKTGHAGVTLATTRGQAERYLRALAADGSRQSIRVRAISTRALSSSWELTADDATGPALHRLQRGPPRR